MEGDAGASRLNPPPMPTNRRLRRRNRTFRQSDRQESPRAADEHTAQVTTEQSPESEAEQTATAEGAAVTEQTILPVTPEDPSESEGNVEQTILPVESEDTSESEGDADTSESEQAAADDTEAVGAGRRPSRLGRGWLAGIAAVLVLCAAAIAAGGYFGALRYHRQAQAIARNDAAALKAAVECVSATQAPDTQAMAASAQKIIDCGTGGYRSEALLNTSMLIQAYQASNIHVQVSDSRAAVERNNNDGSIDVLVAMRVKVTSGDRENETGYRLKVTMAPTDGQYKISKLVQVTK